MIQFSQEQSTLINRAIDWYKYSSELVFQYCGVAGTGKSLVLSEIIRRLGIPKNRIAPMTYTGAAAIVLREKGITNAKTIHSWLYHPVEDVVYNADGSIERDEYFDRPKFRLTFEPKPLENIDLIVIDEASMVPRNMKNEIESRGIKIIATGDLGQLPPVSDEPAYLYDGAVYQLTEIHRQALDSGIVYIADRVRRGLPIYKGDYGEVMVIGEDQLTNQMILESDVVLCGTNRTRDFINKKVREELFNYTSDLPSYGEIMVCRKNNWDLEISGINLVNGTRGKVINEPGVESFDGKTYKIDFMPFGMEKHNKYFSGLECDYRYLIAPSDKKNLVKKDKFSKGEKMEFAYALTTHLSQGSQYPKVVYIEEYLNKDIQNQLNYTGVTRASHGLIYVTRKKKYY